MDVAGNVGHTPTRGGNKPLRLRLPGRVIKRTPDASFGHLSEKYPGVVIEVSSSEKRKNLSRLASEYILGSRAAVRVVVGLDIESKGNKKATISVWKPQVVGKHFYLDIQVMQVVNSEVRFPLAFRFDCTGY